MNVCILCKSTEINNLELGELKELEDIKVHYFCLLLSSSLITNGEEDQGILGFLPSDIKKESRRAIRLKCHYCHQGGATIGCCISSCSRSFHLNCGLKNNCLNQFTDDFKSFCDRHVEDSKKRHSKDHVCIICYMEMGKYNKIQSVFSPCCKSEWFHKNCLMKLADSAGYFFKCPKCNDVQKFTEECMNRGIFVPQRDAAWETEENAFGELMERPSRCNADSCLCVDGRESDTTSNELLICETCGSNCIHNDCWQRSEPYYCCLPINSEILNRLDDRKSRNEIVTDENQNNNAESENNDMSTSSDTLAKVQRKRKIPRHLDDGFESKVKEKKKRRVLKTDKYRESESLRVSPNASNCSSKINYSIENFPITKIRNGTFDQILRLKPRVVLCRLLPENFKIFRIVDQSIDSCKTDKKMSLKTPLEDNNLIKKELAFAVISPTRKNGGKSFKNYTITSFFKPNVTNI